VGDMSLFQCEHCGCCENTALSSQGFKYTREFFNWTGIEDREGKLLCSDCGPTHYSDGSKTTYGVWHNQFPRIFLPKGKFKTNNQGNLEHIETGSIDFKKYAGGIEEEHF